jgi:hypothetical protein
VSEPTPEQPVYRSVRDGAKCLIVCDEGWRQSVVCEGMYDWAADWLVAQIQGMPYAPGAFRPGE